MLLMSKPKVVIRPAIILVWLALLLCLSAWMVDWLALAIESGQPHYAGSNLSQAEIASRTHVFHIVDELFYPLAFLFLACCIGLWLVYKREAFRP